MSNMVKCPWCGAEWDEEELDMDEHDEPTYCPECEYRIIEHECEEE